MVKLGGDNTVTYYRSRTGGVAGWDTPLSSTNNWYHFAITYDGSSGSNRPIFYLNGSLVPVAGQATDGNLSDPAGQVWRIGTWAGDTEPNNQNFKGLLDEVRISDSIRSADWIATDYKNQSSPTTFCRLGPET